MTDGSKNKRAARRQYKWDLAHVVYRTAVNIWPTPPIPLPTGQKAAQLTSMSQKQTAKKQTSKHHRTPEKKKKVWFWEKRKKMVKRRKVLKVK